MIYNNFGARKQYYSRQAVAITLALYILLYAYVSTYWLSPYILPQAIEGIVLQIDAQDYTPQMAAKTTATQLSMPTTKPNKTTTKSNLLDNKVPPILPDTTLKPLPLLPKPDSLLLDSLPIPAPIHANLTTDTIKISPSDSIKNTLTSIDTIGLVVYQNADQPPMFPNGFDAMLEFISQNLVYPPDANGKKGIVYVGFIVLENGQLANPFIKKGISNYPQFDQAALQILSKMPQWQPAHINNQAVRAYYSIPVIFK